MKTTKFKPSEVGPIPVEWEVKSLGEIGEFKNGISKGAESFGHGVPFVNLLDVFGRSSLATTKGLGLVEATHSEIADCGLKHGDTLFVRSSVKPEGVGLATVIEGAMPNTVFSGFLLRYRTSELVAGYMRYAFAESQFRQRVIASSTVSANTNVNQTALKRLAVVVPPRPEQERIAEALSDVDALLTAMTMLIEKKRAIKQGAMQQLLTGKTRLPGFTGKWVEKRLGACGDFVGGGTPSTSITAYWGGSIDWYTPAEIGSSKYVYCSERRITAEGLANSAARILPEGTILLTTRASIGLRAILRREAATNQGFQSLVVNEGCDSEFMYYFLSTVVGEMESRASGSTFLEISSPKLKEIPIVVPPTLAEQQAIAAVLSDMDAEIATLDSKRAKYEQIKQGMMQELLTGRVRLVG